MSDGPRKPPDRGPPLSALPAEARARLVRALARWLVEQQKAEEDLARLRRFS